MKAICTYCSANKLRDAGLLPAVRRYVDGRIETLHTSAEQQGIHFCILSGEYGLIDGDYLLPWYDHLLVSNEIPRLIEVVQQQLREKNITEIEYYTVSPAVDPNVIPYFEVIKKGCARAGIHFREHILP